MHKTRIIQVESVGSIKNNTGIIHTRAYNFTTVCGSVYAGTRNNTLDYFKARFVELFILRPL
jgi:hypothetical protein